MKIQLVYFIFFFLSFYPSNAQIMNTQVKAVLDVKLDKDQLYIKGIAQSKTDAITSISYKLSIIRTNIQSGNQSKNNQSGYQILEPFQNCTLSSTSVNFTQEDRLIILLLIYDVNQKLIATARQVINETRDENQIKQVLSQQMQKQVEKVNKQEAIVDAQINFRGIVVDQTKTKAGRDFYQLYYSNYLSGNINSQHIITITESITLGNNTKITLKTSQGLIFEFFVRTQYDYLKSMSNTAIKFTLIHLDQLEKNKQRTKTF
ncbi:CsgE family curli-type amyloid fiber assembly protein [Myroides pelagicus]|uniref:Curli production assembly/transport component CsgE n=1 Tax=Myroides pelagicus TaxID=270914 RepID=A0A7K1GNW2_9FLAO|nr:CsgE family curli-type amyloid fiber assembly protein [Myroides pelagicus]MTH30567.1 hypothetical protein [Myroides pelagicus]